jgi:DNA-binding NarL/FixJ family response regulator
LEKLHYDLRTLTKYKTAEEYEAELEYRTPAPPTIAFQSRQQHPKKDLVMQMLADGVKSISIERETGVSPKTIRKWRDDMLAARGETQAA